MIFVFGSNTEGRHGKGAAKTALQRHGAIYGQAEGLQGNSYAIITKELRPGKNKVSIDTINLQVKIFIMFALDHPELEFEVTRIGCGLAGFKDHEIGPMFEDAPKNVHLPKGWEKYR